MTSMLDRIAGALGTYRVGSVASGLGHQGAPWAVWTKDGALPERYDISDEADAACRRLNAIAVVEAMREPTEAMMEAARGYLHQSPELVFQAMLDAILKETPEGADLVRETI